MRKMILTLVAAGILTAPAAHGATITVNSDSDADANDGQCTLREAVTSANTNAISGVLSGECVAGGASDNIAFSIGSGQKTIALGAVYPNISSNVTIDATTQPGFSGQPLIELNGQNAAASAFVIGGDNVTITGFAINRFVADGISIQSSAEEFKIQGNYIGIDPSGSVDLGNGESGILCAGGNIGGLIGGALPGEGNVISGNASYGIYVWDSGAHGNAIVGNKIGTDAVGTTPIPNDEDGIMISSGAGDTVVGGDSPAEGNLISGNAKAGVAVEFATSMSNTIRGNSIYSNGGLGIDLGATGFTANDSGDLDTGVNGLQNFPVIESAVSTKGTTVIEGYFDSTPGQDYVLEFFANDAADASGHGEGQTFIGSVSFNTGGGGEQPFSASLTVEVADGQFVTATATGPDGSTSEFSEAIAATFLPAPSGETGENAGDDASGGDAASGSSDDTSGSDAENGASGGCSLIRNRFSPY